MHVAVRYRSIAVFPDHDYPAIGTDIVPVCIKSEPRRVDRLETLPYIVRGLPVVYPGGQAAASHHFGHRMQSGQGNTVKFSPQR